MSPKTKEHFEEIRQRSAAGIMQAALELFAHKGYSGTSISAIAKEAGVSKGLIYNYYASKEALLEAIILGAVEMGDKSFHEGLNPDFSPKEQIHNLIEIGFAMLTKNIQYWKLITSLAFQPGVLDRFKPGILEKGIEELQHLEELFRALGKEKPKQEALFFAAFMDGLALQIMNMGELFPLAEMKAYAIEKFCLS